MLDVKVLPAKGLGVFVLGMSVSEAVKCIQENARVISQVDVKYNDLDPLTMDYIIDFSEDGVLLRFDSGNQRLKLIEIYDVSKIQLSYLNVVFNTPKAPCTFVTIHNCFGPSHPGDFDQQKHIYYLHYPGISFTFPIPSQYDDLYAKGTQDLPLEFPDGTTPVTSRIYVYHGNKLNEQSVPPLPPSSFYFEEIFVNIMSGLTFSKRKCFVGFGSSVQHVLNELGSPQKVYYKEEDKLKIHSNIDLADIGRGDYFFNYFSIGLDILFDRKHHTVKKFVFHTNFPNHFDFNQYAKCNFRIEVPPKNEDAEKPPLITPDMKWDVVQQHIQVSGKPVVHRGSIVNPFGPTLFYGSKNVIFEVMQNGHIASVCLFKPDD